MNRAFIQGVPIDIATAEEAAIRVISRTMRGERTTIGAVNAAIVVASSRNRELLESLRSFDLIIADGKWVAVAASLLSCSQVPHTNTSPFLRALFSRWIDPGPRVFLLGARPEIVRIAANRLPELFPNVTVAGFHDGYFEPDEEQMIIDEINKSHADILFIGISSPKKELFLRSHWADLHTSTAFGIGGLIDIWGGRTREAPEWIRHNGFEWLFRMVQEPRRLLKRYTVDNLTFLYICLRQSLGGLD